jgi:hypothetical protein
MVNFDRDSDQEEMEEDFYAISDEKEQPRLKDEELKILGEKPKSKNKQEWLEKSIRQSVSEWKSVFNNQKENI